MPTASRTAVCSLTTPGGVLQRHRPAAELGELGAERDVPVVQRRRAAGRAAAMSSAMRANLHRPSRPRSRRRAATGRDYPRGDVRTHLRKGEPGQDPRRRRRRRGRPAPRKGAGRWPPAARTSPTAYGRRLAPAAQHARLHRQGRRGRQGAHRRHASRPRCWCWSGSATQPTTGRPPSRRTPGRRRRRPLRRQRRVRRARAAGRRRRRWSAPSPRATSLGGYAFDRYQSKAAGRSGPATVAVLSPAARRQEAVAAFEDAQVVAAAVDAARDWVNTPADDLTPPAVRRRGAGARGREGHQGQGRRSSTRRSWRELGCGGILGVGSGSSARRGWSS